VGEREIEPPKDVLALARLVTEVRQRLDALERSGQVAELAGLTRRLEAIESQNLGENLRRLAQTVAEQAETKAEKRSQVWNWATMTADQQRMAWEILLRWRREVLAVRYPAAYRQIRRRCWYQHPDVVEELTTLYTTWNWAYMDPETTPPRAAEWLDHWLPKGIERIVHLLRQCSMTRHADPMAQTTEDHDDAEFSAWINETIPPSAPAAVGV
jgi:hypothetical protein